MKSIFISHAAKDKVIVESFVDILLVGALAVKIGDIFCTSTDGTKIESGEDWRGEIKKHLEGAKVTFLIITPNYKESEVCQNEMGAAWVCSGRVLPLIVEPIDYSSVGIMQEPKQIEKLLDEKSLDRIKDIVQDELKIPTDEIKSDRWTAKKYEFIDNVGKYLEETNFLHPMDRSIFTEKIEKIGELESAIKTLISERNRQSEMIAELRTANDKEEFEKIEKKYKPSDRYEEFIELTCNLNKLLGKFTGIVIGLIYGSFSEKDLSIDWQLWDKELSEAQARDYIDESSGVLWHETAEMIHVDKALCELSEFLSNAEGDSDFVEQYEKEFSAPIKIRNLSFWEEVLDVNIRIS